MSKHDDAPDLLAALQDSITRARAARKDQQEIDRLGALAAFWENRTIEATARMHPDLARARAASEAVTIQALRDENQALTAEVARLRAMLPDPATHTHDGTRRDHTINPHATRTWGGYHDEGI